MIFFYFLIYCLMFIFFLFDKTFMTNMDCFLKQGQYNIICS